jgi:hypothetical protein
MTADDFKAAVEWFGLTDSTDEVASEIIHSGGRAQALSVKINVRN